jgi:hypothetical protein
MRKIFTIAIIALSVNAFAQIPTNGLVGYWPFSGNANDLSGSGNNGIIHNASLTTDRFGQPNSAYQFVGNDNNTLSYIGAGYNNLPSGNTPRTISVWLTHDTYDVPGGAGNDSHPILSYGLAATNSDNEIMFRTTPSGIRNLTYAGFNNDLDIPFNYNLQTWYNVVTTFDGTNAKIYVNDSLLGAGLFSNWNTVLDSMLFGTQATKTRFHNGKVDDVRIYSRVLNASEISSLFHEGLCFQTITVTDTLLINMGITGFNPITYSNTIKIFPNPTNDHITIDYGNFVSLNGYQLKIENSLGQQVFQTNVTQQSDYLNLTNWGGNGLYFVRIIDLQGNTIDIRKIVLQ